MGRFRCHCGKIGISRLSLIRSGTRKSCGCEKQAAFIRYQRRRAMNLSSIDRRVVFQAVHRYGRNYRRIAQETGIRDRYLIDFAARLHRERLIALVPESVIRDGTLSLRAGNTTLQQLADLWMLDLGEVQFLLKRELAIISAEMKAHRETAYWSGVLYSQAVWDIAGALQYREIPRTSLVIHRNGTYSGPLAYILLLSREGLPVDLLTKFSRFDALVQHTKRQRAARVREHLKLSRRRRRSVTRPIRRHSSTSYPMQFAVPAPPMEFV